MRPFSLSSVLVAVPLVLFPAGAGAVAVAAETPQSVSSFTIADPRIKESSGLAASKRHPGVYWTHNDSDDGPYVYGVDAATGRTVARITLTGIGVPRDVEAVSLGPDGQLYVGDIGDNRGGTWDRVWIYRFPEPDTLGDRTVKATKFTVRYEDGPRDAESLMVHPVTGRVYIASKNQNGGGLYEGPEQLSTGGSNVFRRIAEVPWVTDGAFSPDGTHLTLRGYLLARTYPWRDGRPQGEGERVDAPWQGQAESVTYAPDGRTLLFGAEGENSRVLAVPVPSAGASQQPGRPAPAPAAAGTPGGAAGAGSDTGNLTVGGLALAGLAALLFGARRLTRRGRSGAD
ncbi:WD40 repeat domain-containing protein [Streptomyces antimicrobicus]|uniref:WD40 repeat domain-containing protein n=1 Tax=Streptomyces antimicrobicus TaxID=2883108 RepID=A0ABS8B158_9ACTN|nr:WD40 repeat domain-containing protein [Streptomyces antimicrobicus]MCB5178351.1 WD40 repeat domain-containing protein [Streptomyces antimicrobicus]